jgi:AcrR family transcriptional regulator
MGDRRTRRAGASGRGRGLPADPRIRRTRAVIEEAFIRLVREIGYDSVSVEQVVEAADVAKATFYRHYENKEALLAALSERLVYGLADPADGGDTPLPAGAHASVNAAYQHAAELRDLYQVCLADARARAAYVAAFERHSEEQLRRGAEMLGREARIPPAVMATFFAGAHVALLESWLNGTVAHAGDEVASMELALFVAGAAWSHQLTLDELSNPEIVAAIQRHDSNRVRGPAHRPAR